MERQREIVRLWMAGKPRREIAETVKSSPGYVSNVVSTAQALGFKAKPFSRGKERALTPEQVAKAADCRANGMSFPQIAQQFGVSHMTVMRAVRRAKNEMGANDGVPGQGQ